MIIILIKWLFHWEYTQHFQTNPYGTIAVSKSWAGYSYRTLHAHLTAESHQRNRRCHRACPTEGLESGHVAPSTGDASNRGVGPKLLLLDAPIFLGQNWDWHPKMGSGGLKDEFSDGCGLTAMVLDGTWLRKHRLDGRFGHSLNWMRDHPHSPYDLCSKHAVYPCISNCRRRKMDDHPLDLAPIKINPLGFLKWGATISTRKWSFHHLITWIIF